MVSTNFKARTRQDFVVALGAMLLALVMILSLTSCSKEKGAQSSEQLFELHTYTQLKAESLSAVPNLCENNFFTTNGRTSKVLVHEKQAFILQEGDRLKEIIKVSAGNQAATIAYLSNGNVTYTGSGLVFKGSKDGLTETLQYYDIASDTFVSATEQKKIEGYIADIGYIGQQVYYDIRTEDSVKIIARNLMDLTEKTVASLDKNAYRSLDAKRLATSTLKSGITDYTAGYYYFYLKEEVANRLIRLNLENGEQTTLYTGDFDANDFSYIYAINGHLYTNGLINGYSFEEGLFLLENDSATKVSNYLPEKKSDPIVHGGIIAYDATNSPKRTVVLIDGDDEVLVESDELEAEGFAGKINGNYYFKNGARLVKWDTTQNAIADELHFYGDIYDITDSSFVGVGNLVIKHEQTTINDTVNTYYENGPTELMIVYPTETEQREEIVEVFRQSESNQQKAVEIVETQYYTDIVTLVKDAQLTASEVGYSVNEVTVSLTGQFRYASGVYQSGIVVFSANIETGTCNITGGDVSLSTLRAVYEQGL